MKKPILLLIMIFSVTLTFAQNTAKITQTGNDHTSTNLQIGADNLITVIQTSETNSNPVGYKSEISQYGSENKADVKQGGSNQDYAQGSKGGSLVDISQTGTKHSAIVDQNGNVGGLAKLTQKGVNQITEVWNANGIGQAVVYQDALAKNEAYLYQNRGNANGYIKQTLGDGNLALVNQYRADKSEIIQEGIKNTGYVKQNHPTVNNTGVSTGNIYQYGSGNGVGTFVPGIMGGYNGGGQTASIYGATVFIKQSGTNNTTDNLANIFQGGNASGKILEVYGNSAGIDQDLADNSTSTISQFSDFNTANIIQNGGNNFTSVLQKAGDYNIVNITQEGAASADILQDGDHNTLMGIGSDPLATSLNGSFLQLEQTGSENTLHLQQTLSASARVMQIGCLNITTVIQN